VKTFAAAGMLITVFAWSAAGCYKGSSPAPPIKPPAHEHEHDHAHGEHGPHNGDLIELGGGSYHAELVHDDASKLVTIYLLGKDAKAPAPIAEESLVVSALVEGKPQQFVLAAKPQEGDGENQSSRFELTDAALVGAIDNPDSKARLNVTIEGRPYVGTIEAHHHDHK
jgi:hypothetical protein